MGLPYVPLYVVFPRGKEAIALRVALQKPKAWAYVAEMWCGVAQNAADGRVEGPAAVHQLEDWAGWDGAPGAFVEALCLPHIGLLDVTERGFYVHNWDLHCGLHIQKREKDRERKRASRKTKDTSADGPRKVRGQKKDVRRKSTEEVELEQKQITTTTSAKPTPAEARWPLLAALLLALHERGFEGEWPRDEKTADRLEQAIRDVTLAAAIDRAWAVVESDRAFKVAPRTHLGWYLDAIRGKRQAPPRTHGDLGAELIQWNQRLSAEDHRTATAELRALARLDPDLEYAPLGVPGNPDSPAYEAVQQINAKWRAVAEARP